MSKIKGSDLILTFLMPMIIGKSLVLYFGSKYSEYPDEGYGYGLVFAIVFTLTMIGRFLWKNRNYKS